MMGVDSFEESLSGHAWPSRDGKDDGCDGYEMSGVRLEKWWVCKAGKIWI